MHLHVKKIGMSTGGPLIAVLHSKDAGNLGVFAQDRIKIKRMRSKESIVVVADVGPRGVHPGEIGLFEEAFEKLGVPEGTAIHVETARMPESLNFIHAKLNGKKLNQDQMTEIVRSIIENKISTVELTYFVAGCYTMGLDMEESAYLTNAIVNTGDRLKFNHHIVFDKHCIGGVPGNRTTMIVTPIIAAAGYIMPKTSSRAITSPAGTADTVEVLAPVALSKDRILDVIKKTKACMVWGGAMHLAGADEYMVRVRHPLSIDPEGMLLASILAKKKAVGATHVLIDIPYGPNTKLETRRSAKRLRRKFEKLAKLIGLNIKVILTDGSQPIGCGIGPALEVRDVLSVLQGDGPVDLMEKSVFMAAEMLKMAGIKDAREKVLEILQSGAALRKFREIIVAQGGPKSLAVPKADHFQAIVSKGSGKAVMLNNKFLARVARVAGAPSDKTAGIYLCVKRGAKVSRGDELFFIYSQSKEKLDNAVYLAKKFDCVTVD